MDTVGQVEQMLYTVPEAARALGLSVPQLRDWMARGIVPVWRAPGCHPRIRRSDLVDVTNRYVVTADASR